MLARVKKSLSEHCAAGDWLPEADIIYMRVTIPWVIMAEEVELLNTAVNVEAETNISEAVTESSHCEATFDGSDCETAIKSNDCETAFNGSDCETAMDRNH